MWPDPPVWANLRYCLDVLAWFRYAGSVRPPDTTLTRSMDMSMQLEIANCSDTGQKRPHNEDSTGSDPRLGLAILADGMGGYKAGEVASAIAVTSIMAAVRTGLPKLGQNQADAKTGYHRQSLLLKQAIDVANRNIFDIARSEPSCRGMGTTVVVLLLQDERLSVAHVGDSRLYRLRGEQLQQITSDHSLIQELVSRGLYTSEQALATTPRNLVTRALGIESTVDIDILEERVRDGDLYLLCSDGLNDMVSDEEIRLTLGKYSANLAQSARELVRLANRKGGRDNVSVVLVRKLGTTKQSGNMARKLLSLFN